MFRDSNQETPDWPHEHTEGKAFVSGWVNYPDPANHGPLSEPSLRVVPIVKTPEIEPGDDILIDVYLAGYGKPERTKLSIYHSHPKILDESSPGYIVSTIAGKVDWEANEVDLLYPGWTSFHNGLAAMMELNLYGTTAALPPVFFIDDPQWRDRLEEQGATESVFDDQFPRIMSESAIHGYAPIRIKYQTHGSARPGDYSIKFILTYRSEGSTQTTQSNVDVHIKNKKEQWDPYATYAAICAAIIALASLVYQTGLINYLFEIIFGIGA